MKVLHTADWHLGKRLFDKNRHADAQAFLTWLTQTLCQEQVEVLLIAGDVFDSTTPSNTAQTLYYEFLANLRQTPCHTVVITSGNHDSPSLLEAPKALMQALNIHVVAQFGAGVDDQLLLIKDGDTPKLAIAAVPYLRDNDVRVAHDGDSTQERHHATQQGIGNHYQALFAKAKSHGVPTIAMGHLFAQGGCVGAQDDGMRQSQLRVGGLGQSDVASFGAFDYIALGHLHRHQTLGSPYIRYSGSPFAMGFDDALHDKYVVLVEFGDTITVCPILVPPVRSLLTLEGDLATLNAKLNQIPASHALPTWVQIRYTAPTPIHNLSDALASDDTRYQIISIQNKSVKPKELPPKESIMHLQQMTPDSIFATYLDQCDYDTHLKDELLAAHAKILTQVQETDEIIKPKI